MSTHICTVCNGSGYSREPYISEEGVAVFGEICPGCSGAGFVRDGSGPFGGNCDWLD